MQIKNRLFVFSKEGCVEHTNPPDIDKYATNKFCVINPDLSRVQGIERQYWKLEDGQVLPMAQHERNERKEYLESLSVIKHTPLTEFIKSDAEKALFKEAVKLSPPKSHKYSYITLAAMAAAAAVLAYLKLKGL